MANEEWQMSRSIRVRERSDLQDALHLLGVGAEEGSELGEDLVRREVGLPILPIIIRLVVLIRPVVDDRCAQTTG